MSPLPDYLLPLDEATARERMLARMSAALDKSEGELTWDIIQTTAYELALEDDRIRYAFDLGFVQTTVGEFLDLKGGEHGVPRRLATPAHGVIAITGTVGHQVDAGTPFSTEGAPGVAPQIYTTDITVVIPGGGVVDVAVTAVATGTAGNVGAGTIVMPPDDPDITAVTNLDPLTDAIDTEEDEAYAARILIKVQNPGTSGNKADYRNWALEVPGVGAAAVVPLAAGPGTVTVAIVNSDKDPATTAPALVTAVQDYIAPAPGDGKAPIGADVTVEAATAVPIDVAATLTIVAGYARPAVEAAIDQALTDYLKSLALTEDNDVRHARVVTTILDVPGVLDATAVLVNGAAVNVAIAATEVAVLDVTTWA